MTVASSAGSAFGSLVQMKQSSAPDAVTETLNSAVTALGGSDLVLYLVDYEQTVLLPHPDTLPHGQHPEPASIEGTMAGKAFTTGSCQAAHRPDGWHVWVPVSERGNGLGVLALTLPNWDEEADRHCVDLGSAAAYMLVAAAR